MNNEQINDNVFIGARALSNEQVKLIVPTYDSIVEQIEEIRKQAKNQYDENKGEKRENSFQNKQYNNTIGIFGERGTGKTSFLYTLMQQLRGNIKNNKEKCNGNIILPIIEPDNFSENSKILGAILGVLKKEIDSIECRMKNGELEKKDFEDFFSDCKFKLNNPLNTKYNELLEYYCYKESEYRKLLTESYTDMETYKKKYSYLLSPDMEFSNKMKDFIDKLVAVERECSEKEPLIFLFIDDIDLNTSKCKELIESIMQYTCHPNVICILSGDYEILKEAMFLSLLENENVNSELLNNNELFDSKLSLIDRKKYLANDYLKKILPPAFRHNVVKWNLDNIPKFTFEQKTSSEKVYLYEKLNEVFEDNIFCSKFDNKRYVIVPKTPYNIFDTTPRGLVNVYYSLSKFDMKKFHENVEMRFIYTKSFIDTLISSSRFLAPYQNIIFNKYILWGNEEKNTLVHFDEIGKELIELIGEEVKLENKKTEQILFSRSDKEKLKEFMSFFILGVFVKKLLPNIVSIEYEKTKQSFMYSLYRSPWFSGKNINVEPIISWKNFMKDEKYLYSDIFIYNAAISDFLRYTDLKFSLIFYEELREIFDKEDIYMAVTNNNVQLYNKKVFNVVYNTLFIREEEALNSMEQWYNIKYENNGKMNFAIELLDKIGRQPKEYDLAIDILKLMEIDCNNEGMYIQYYMEYKYLQDSEKSITYKRKENSLDGESYFRTVDNVYDKYIKKLFINKFRKIIKNEDKDINIRESKKTLKNTDKYERLYKILVQLQDDKYKSSREKLEKYISKSILAIGQNMQSFVQNIMEYKSNCDSYKENLYYQINVENINEEIEKFYNQNNDGYKDTVYKKTYSFIKEVAKNNHFSPFQNESTINTEQYIKIIDKLNYLAYRTNAWYGVSEARKLLQFINNNADLRLPNYFQCSIAPIILEYSKYVKKFNQSIIKEDEFQKKKDRIVDLLDKAFIKVRDQEQGNLKEFGLELEDTEEDLEI